MKVRKTPVVNTVRPASSTNPTQSSSKSSGNTFETVKNIGKQVVKHGKPVYQMYQMGQAAAIGSGVIAGSPLAAASAVAAPLVASLQAIIHLNSGVVEIEGQIASAMTGLADKMHSKDPAIRKSATQQAKQFLQKAWTRAAKDPKFKKALLGWYQKFVVGGGKHSKYNALYKQMNKEMQPIHKAWYDSHSWFGRLLISKQTPKS